MHLCNTTYCSTCQPWVAYSKVIGMLMLSVNCPTLWHDIASQQHRTGCAHSAQEEFVNMQIVQRPLMLSERMVALAAAVSVDYDYFSQHSHGSGWFAPMMFPPVPYPSGGGAEGGAEGAEGGDQGTGEAVPGDAGRIEKQHQILCKFSGTT